MDRSPDDIYDELLVLRCQDGDHDAFHELVARWHKRLWRHAWHLAGQQDAAWDVVQEAWMAIVRGIRKLDDPVRFRHWAYRIVTHKAVDWTRRQQRQRRLAQDVSREAVQAAESPGNEDETDRLRQALNRLSGDRRALLSLRHVEGISVVDIAKILDIPEGTVKSRLHHARNELKNALRRE